MPVYSKLRCSSTIFRILQRCKPGDLFDPLLFHRRVANFEMRVKLSLLENGLIKMVDSLQ